MHTRAKQIRASLKKKKLSALFITTPQNITYLTGFAGLSPGEREAFVLITSTTLHFFTFSTYIDGTDTLDKQIDIRLITSEKRLSAHIREILKDLPGTMIGFEKDNLTVGELSQLQKQIPVSWVETDGIVEHARLIKDEQEIHLLQEAARCTDEVFTALLPKMRLGISEWQIAAEIEYQIKQRGADISFAPIAAFDAHAATPHHFPSPTTKIADNTLILLDFGAKTQGYCADMTRVVFFGTPKPEYIAVYNTVKEAQQQALDYLQHWRRDEVHCVSTEVDKMTRDYISSRGYAPYSHGLGHGVGLAIHEAPRLSPNSNDILQPGMAVTVEPGIYIPESCGVRIEDLIVTTETGIDILSHSTKELTVL